MTDWGFTTLRLAIEEAGKCPMCLELVKPPVILCVNGHGTCTACKGAITKCPTCRQPFSVLQPRILNEILGKIPKVCKHYDEGCGSPATNDHELYCKFRTVKCIFHDEDNLGYCDWEGPAKDFDKHVYLTKHLEPGYTDLINHCPLSIFFCKFTELSPKKSILSDLNIDNVFEGQMFILTHTIINGNFCMYINHFPLEKPTETIFITLSFDNRAGEVIYKYKMKATEAITLDRNCNVEENVYCLRVPVEELNELVNEVNGSLFARFEVTTKPLKLSP